MEKIIAVVSLAMIQIVIWVIRAKANKHYGDSQSRLIHEISMLLDKLPEREQVFFIRIMQSWVDKKGG